jgi:hypothetical protein
MAPDVCTLNLNELPQPMNGSNCRFKQLRCKNE